MLLSTNPESFTKRTSDAFNIEVNFSKYLHLGETITSARVYFYDTNTQEEVSHSQLLNCDPAMIVDHKIVKYFIKSGQPNKAEYKSVIEITTSEGNTYSADQYAYIID